MVSNSVIVGVTVAVDMITEVMVPVVVAVTVFVAVRRLREVEVTTKVVV